MFGGFFGLTLSQKIYLEISMVLPIILPIIVLKIIDDALISLISYQLLCCIIIPYGYIKYLSKEKEISPYFFNEFRDKKNQITTGLTGLSISLIVIFSSYILCYEFSFNSILNTHVPIQFNTLYLLFLMILLVFANPLLEEWFWRVFLVKTLENSNKIRDWINLHYGIYHFYIIFHLIGLKSAFIFTMTYLSFGRSMQFMKEKYGYLSCVLTHLGISLGILFVFFDVLYLQKDNMDAISHQNK